MKFKNAKSIVFQWETASKKLGELKKQLTAAEAKVAKLNESSDTLRMLMEPFKLRLKALDVEREKLVAELGEMQGQIDTVPTQLPAIQQNVDELRGAIVCQQKQVDKWVPQLDEAKAVMVEQQVKVQMGERAISEIAASVIDKMQETGDVLPDGHDPRSFAEALIEREKRRKDPIADGTGYDMRQVDIMGNAPLEGCKPLARIIEERVKPNAIILDAR